MAFRLRFPENEIPKWAKLYVTKTEEMALENEIIEEIAPGIQSRGYLTKADLLLFSKWKSGGRTRHLVTKNSEEYIKQITAASLSATNERFKIEVLTLLDGVGWPTASILLHICANDPYPVLDFRALWSLSMENNIRYNFKFWSEYTLYCRKLSDRCNVDIRTLDRALWQYSYERQ